MQKILCSYTAEIQDRERHAVTKLSRTVKERIAIKHRRKNKSDSTIEG